MSIEERGRRRARKRNFKKALLYTVGLAGALSLAVVAPNVLGACIKIGIPLTPDDMPAIARARRRLVKSGLLTYDRKFLRLTAKGQAQLARYGMQGLQKRQRRWDGRWRVLIFDIPEHSRNIREKLRHALRAFGFHLLQHSVWVFPYDCEEFITLLKADFKIGKNVLYMIVDELEFDAPLKKHFNL